MYEAFNDSVCESPDDGASYYESWNFSEAEFCCGPVSDKLFERDPEVLFQFFFVQCYRWFVFCENDEGEDFDFRSGFRVKYAHYS